MATQDAKSAKLSRKGGAPVFSPSRLLAAVCKIAPIFKVGSAGNCRHCGGANDSVGQKYAVAVTEAMQNWCRAVSGQGGQQQDSHELMRCLVEGLHAEEQRALEQLRKKARTQRSPSLTSIQWHYETAPGTIF